MLSNIAKETSQYKYLEVSESLSLQPHSAVHYYDVQIIQYY